ncbi:MAG: sulfite reductase [Hyphomicrobiales bacterium]|nr:sulfite reductase [Hyphomicrobiales bacterium]
MYRYDEFDAQFVRERVGQFRTQVARRLDGSITEDEFKPLRLKNGVYLQLHAYMLRIAIPYGTLSSRQLRQLALIAEKFDRSYGHFTTRTNMQFNWPKLRDVPEILDLLADVEMHCIQTSGNCIRNVTADHFAGIAADEIEDPRPTAELLRQWSSLHPEFSYLPRKFKIAVTGSARDRAVVRAHDIGLRIVRDPKTREIGYEVMVGGGLGRTPMIAKTIRSFLPRADLLAYLEAVMRVYNLEGRRDNKYKARVKILVHELGAEEFSRLVEAEFARLDGPSVNADPAEVARIAAYFADPAYDTLPARSTAFEAAKAENRAFAHWTSTNLFPHRVPGYTALTVSLKPIGEAPGDITADQMRAVADLAERYSFDELRVTHAQNVVLPYVRKDDLFAVWEGLVAAGLATANVGLITDIIACPGLDYCALATARSIPIAQAIAHRFADEKKQAEIGELNIKISGCINACGHHHVGHIGILGLEKSGQESYQITLGGDATETAAIGKLLGPGLAAEDVPDAIERIVGVYLAQRDSGETFIEAVRRLGLDPFKIALQEKTHAVA